MTPLSNLSDLLADLQTEADARDLVDLVGLDARYIEFRGNPVNVWNNVLREARSKPGKLNAIVDHVIKRHPDYADKLTENLEEYLRSHFASERAEINRVALFEKVEPIVPPFPNAERTDWKPIAIQVGAIVLAPFIALLAAVFATANYGRAIGAVVGCSALITVVGPVLIVGYLFRPRASSTARVWLYTLGGLFSAFALVGGLRSLRDLTVRWLIDALREFGLNVPALATDEYLLPYFVVLCGTVCTLAVVWTMDRRRTITPPPTELGRLFDKHAVNEEHGFPEALRRYCGALVDYLNAYDREVNWSDRDYASLEAEVEAERAGRLRSKLVANLVKAIRRDRHSPTFVLIGEPGSGKSVSLRNLVRSLIAEARRSGVVPVYVNLREFPSNRRVVVDELVRFAHESVREQTGRDGEAFLNGWYERFRRSGRLFFVFDSFDELPQVLDADDRSDTHRKVCESFDRLFTQEVRSCRAVLASRPFRAPSGVQGTRLVIRQLTEAQVRQVVGARVLGRGFDAAEFVRRVFRNRPELTPLLRNPFTAELLTDFARERNGELPASTFDIFNAYVTSRMEADEPLVLERLGLRAEELRRAAQTLAIALFQGDRGLEAEATWAIAELDRKAEGRGRDLVEGLKYTRLARVGGHSRVILTFAHRRFAEFFAVEAMLSEGATPPIEHIPTDSRWRDGLVMYCGVASEPERIRVAEFCWQRVREQSTKLMGGRVADAGDATHCLRFLIDAFRSAPGALVRFRVELGLLVRKMLKSGDPLGAKLAAEAIPLADEHGQQLALLRAMASPSNWVRETAISACRNLPQLRDRTKKAVRGYYRSMSTIEKARRFRDLDFSLGLSEAFRPIRWALWVDVLEAAFLIAMTSAMFVCLPVTSTWRVSFLLPFLSAFLLCLRTVMITAANRIASRSTRFTALHSASSVARPPHELGGLSEARIDADSALGRPRAHAVALMPRRTSKTAVRTRFFTLLKPLSDGVRGVLFTLAYAVLIWSMFATYRIDDASLKWSNRTQFMKQIDPDGISRAMREAATFRSPNNYDKNARPTITRSIIPATIGIAIIVLCVSGWENILAGIFRLYSPSNWRRILTAILRNRRSIAKELASLIGFGAAMFLVLWAISAFGGRPLTILMLILFITGVCLVIASVVWHFVRTAWNRYLDGKVLSRGIPERVTAEHLFGVLQELRSAAGRRDYLQGLLSRRVSLALSGEASSVTLLSFSDPPAVIREVLYEDPGVAEDWSKLQELWLGLSR
jgi:hypothetical protein